MSFKAVSAGALTESVDELNSLPPAPLGPKYEREIKREFLEKMVASLYANYDKYNLQTAFWGYWHAIAAPVHIAAVHYGAVIEALQKTFVEANASLVKKEIVDAEKWQLCFEKISICISDVDAPSEEKEILLNKAKNLNFSPQNILLKKFLEALNIQIDDVETAALKSRNRAAHGGKIGREKFGDVIRKNKVLMVLINRIFLAISGGSDSYYDYYTLGRPTSRLESPIPNDKVI